MTSQALTGFQSNLVIVDEVFQAAPGPGSPRKGHKGAVVAASCVLLTSTFEGYVEALFLQGADARWPKWTSAESNSFVALTTDNFHNATQFNTNRLFCNLGIPWIVNGIRWAHYSNASVCSTVSSILRDRGTIAHSGTVPRLSMPQMRVRCQFVERYANHLDSRVEAEIRKLLKPAKLPTWW